MHSEEEIFDQFYWLAVCREEGSKIILKRIYPILCTLNRLKCTVSHYT